MQSMMVNNFSSSEFDVIKFVSRTVKKIKVYHLELFKLSTVGIRKAFIVRVMTLISLLLCLGFLLSSCNSNTFNTETELQAHIKEESNSYIQHKTVNGVDFTLMYKPTDLLVNQELGDDVTASRIEELRNKYSKYLYFNLSMSKNNQELLSSAVGNRNEFGAMVNQLAFRMNEKVHLYTASKDTLEMADFVYPRMYGMSRSTSILFVYPREDSKLKGGILNFTIEDLGLYTGEVKFKIDTKLINNQPQLSFKR